MRIRSLRGEYNVKPNRTALGVVSGAKPISPSPLAEYYSFQRQKPASNP